jgi:hypothetical protein
MTVTGGARGTQQAMNFHGGQAERLALALGAHRLDSAGDVRSQPALGLRPTAQAAQRFQAPVHGGRAQATLGDQVLPITR